MDCRIVAAVRKKTPEKLENWFARLDKISTIFPDSHAKMSGSAAQPTLEATSKNEPRTRTVFENHRKSLIQHCERSEIRIHFELTKVNQKCQKWSILASF